MLNELNIHDHQFDCWNLSTCVPGRKRGYAIPGFYGRQSAGMDRTYAFACSSKQLDTAEVRGRYVSKKMILTSR